ncbi:UNKNOWN [Stylonychia lemnae]|uniref:EF-hand domain-containing protein n=1 Tax=Stylonychia lemnae TaxID=5949 RepID=A0A078A195_STYLE|nr:UNKNOWN [Stylonychia lemnae]|eukprot:CDW75845.1 UNKNOWN [Stylonychia lemnae]
MQLKSVDFQKKDPDFDGTVSTEILTEILQQKGVMLDQKQVQTILNFFSVEEDNDDSLGQQQCQNQDKFYYLEFFAIAKELKPQIQPIFISPRNQPQSKINNFTSPNNQHNYSSDQKSNIRCPKSYQKENLQSRMKQDNEAQEQKITEDSSILDSIIYNEAQDFKKISQQDQQFQQDLFLATISRKVFYENQINENEFFGSFELHQGQIISYVDFQTYLKGLGLQYSIDDISELLFQWIPKGADGMGERELRQFYCDLKQLYERQN